MLSSKHKTDVCNLWANNLPLFDDDKNMSYLKEMRKEHEKAPSQVMLIYKVQDINNLYDKGIAYEHESS